MSNLYALQYQFAYTHRKENQTDEEFKKSYFPWYWFHSGIIIMDHEDKQPDIKQGDYCGSDITCKTLQLSKIITITQIPHVELIVIEWIKEKTKKKINKYYFSK